MAGDSLQTVGIQCSNFYHGMRSGEGEIRYVIPEVFHGVGWDMEYKNFIENQE
jgi:hypothetical protein